MKYTREYLVHYYEIDNKKKLSLPSLIHYFEDLATLNSEAQGLTLDYYEQNNCGWMLLKWDISIYSMPSFNEVIKIVTHPSSFKNFLANRDYKVYDKEGGLIIEASTVWLLADTKTRKPLRVPEIMYERFDINHESENHFNKLEDLQATTGKELHSKIKVMRRDIDTNLHVNNVRYVECAMDSLPYEFISKHSVTRLIVNYKKELNLDDEAEITGEVKEIDGILESYHTITCTGKAICYLKFFWKKNS